MIWKQDQMLEKSKLMEEQLQSSLKRKHLVCETLEAANKTLQGENSHMAKNLREMKRDSEACEVGSQQELKMQAVCLQKQKQHIQRLEMILNQMEARLHERSMELGAAYKETNRLVEEYNKLNKKYESVSCEYMQLQSRLRSLEQRIKITEKYSSKKANSPCAEFLQDNFLQLECGDINQIYQNRADETEDATSYWQIEESRAGISKPWHTPLFQNFSNDGISITGNVVRPEKGANLSTFGKDLHEEQPCLVNGMDTLVDRTHTMLELDAKQYQPCPLLRPLNTCFSKSGSTARKQWSISRQTPKLAYTNVCMETKGELDNAIIDAHSIASDAAQSSTSLELQKIQEEIREREKSWKQIEASMRAELSRRKVQLNEVSIM